MNQGSTSGLEDDEQGSHIDEHMCLDLLQGLLSPAEEERILSHVADCPRCERLLQERAAEAERLEATRVLRILPGEELVLEKRGTAVRVDAGDERRWWFSSVQLGRDMLAGLRRPRLQLAVGLAAAAAVLVLIVWPRGVLPPGSPHLYVLRPYSFELQPREIPGSTVGENLRAGLEAYDSGDFERAVMLLSRAESLELDEVHETVRRIYLGSALAWCGKYEEASEILKEISYPLVPGEWGREAHWTLYVALKESGHEASADSLLSFLAKKPGEVGERACQILQLEGQD